MTTTFRLCLIAFAIVLLLDQSQSQILPDSLCTACAFLFRNNGCFQTQSMFCRILAIKLNFQIDDDRPLCSQFPCEGYGRTGSQCVGLFTCAVGDVASTGMCPIGQVCCDRGD